MTTQILIDMMAQTLTLLKLALLLMCFNLSLQGALLWRLWMSKRGAEESKLADMVFPLLVVAMCIIYGVLALEAFL